MSEPDELVSNGSSLSSVYGEWPSFHDARFDRVVVEREGPTVTLVFRTNDAPSKDGVVDYRHEVLARVTLRCADVHDLLISGIDHEENNWIDGLTVSREGELIRLEIERMDGTYGFIVAGSVELTDVTVIRDCS